VDVPCLAADAGKFTGLGGADENPAWGEGAAPAADARRASGSTTAAGLVGGGGSDRFVHHVLSPILEPELSKHQSATINILLSKGSRQCVNPELDEFDGRLGPRPLLE
jgi:hypothetical protein